MLHFYNFQKTFAGFLTFFFFGGEGGIEMEH